MEDEQEVARLLLVRQEVASIMDGLINQSAPAFVVSDFRAFIEDVDLYIMSYLPTDGRPN